MRLTPFPGLMRRQTGGFLWNLPLNIKASDPFFMRVVLISTYDLGRQPFGLASPTAWLRAEGHHVTTADLSREPLPTEAVRAADWIAFHLPMHKIGRASCRERV